MIITPLKLKAIPIISHNQMQQVIGENTIRDINKSDKYSLEIHDILTNEMGIKNYGTFNPSHIGPTCQELVEGFKLKEGLASILEEHDWLQIMADYTNTFGKTEQGPGIVTEEQTGRIFLCTADGGFAKEGPANLSEILPSDFAGVAGFTSLSERYAWDKLPDGALTDKRNPVFIANYFNVLFGPTFDFAYKEGHTHEDIIQSLKECLYVPVWHDFAKPRGLTGTT